MEYHSGLRYLPEIIILLFAAISVVVLFYRVKISPVLGYFVAGASIGPYGLKLVKSSGMIDIFAHFGLVFLLFLIGLELSFRKLAKMRKQVFGFGTLQIILTAFLISAICHYLLSLNLKAAAIIGCSLTLSSTAMVLQVLQESNQTSTQIGRLSIAVLILQDIAVVPLLVLVPLLASKSTSIVWILLANAFIKGIIALFLILVISRILFRPLFSIIAATENDELFMAITLLTVLSSAYLTEKFGLSMALGAFVAGLLLAETEYSYKIEQVILPFKKLLLGLFFMTVGMSIDIKLLVNELWLITIGTILLLTVKFSIIFCLFRLFRFNVLSALYAALLLAQGGEFAFILFGFESSTELLGERLSQILMSIVTITIAVTPLLVSLAYWLNKMINREQIFNNISKTSKGNKIKLETADINQYTIIAGFGRVGRTVAKILTAAEIDYVAIDINTIAVQKGQNAGFAVYSGDISASNTLQAIDATKANAIILTIKNDVTIKRTIKLLKNALPNKTIIVRSSDADRVKEYSDLGADVLISEVDETGLQLAVAALKINFLGDFSIKLLKERFRNSNYHLIEKISKAREND